MNVSTIPAVPGSRKRKRRVGRGPSSGCGKTSKRGQKGQMSRSGSSKRPGFEGGRNPLIRRLPKRGFRQKATGRPVPCSVVNLGQLERCPDGEKITPELLEQLGLIRDAKRPVKLLADGVAKKAFTICVHSASKAAIKKVSDSGGAIELSGTPNRKR